MRFLVEQPAVRKVWEEALLGICYEVVVAMPQNKNKTKRLSNYILLLSSETSISVFPLNI